MSNKIAVFVFVLFCASSGCSPDQTCGSNGQRIFPGYAGFSPGTENLRLGERLRVTFTLPYHVINRYDSTPTDLKSFHTKFANLYVTNQRSGAWSGRFFPQIGAFVSDQTNPGSGTFYLSEADTSAIGALEILPADTGIYLFHVDLLEAGDGCFFNTTRPVIINTDRHQHLADLPVTSAGDSAYRYWSYYFRVTP